MTRISRPIHVILLNEPASWPPVSLHVMSVETHHRARIPTTLSVGSEPRTVSSPTLFVILSFNPAFHIVGTPVCACIVSAGLQQGMTLFFLRFIHLGISAPASRCAVPHDCSNPRDTTIPFIPMSLCQTHRKKKPPVQKKTNNFDPSAVSGRMSNLDHQCATCTNSHLAVQILTKSRSKPNLEWL